MDLIILVAVIALIGAAVYWITHQTYLPIPPVFQWVIYILVCVVMFFWLLRKLNITLPNVMN